MANLEDDADLVDFIKINNNYITYTLERRMNDITAGMTATLCNTFLEQGEIVPTNQESTFQRLNGDTIEEFLCTKKIGEIEHKATKCFNDIPLANGTGFVKTSNKLFAQYSAPVPCNNYYGLKVKTYENIWLELNPTAKKLAQPEIRPTTNMEHEDMSVEGLFTPTELEAWRNHLDLGDVHDSLMRTITSSLCAEEGSCPRSPGIPTTNIKFNPEAFLKDTEDKLNTTFFSNLHQWIQDTGAYLALIVITLECVKFLNFAAMVSLTMIRDGTRGVIAVFYLICCNPHKIANQVNRRNRRLDLKRKRSNSSAEDHFNLRQDYSERETEDMEIG